MLLRANRRTHGRRHYGRLSREALHPAARKRRRKLCPRCMSAGRYYRFELSRFAVVGHSREQAYRIGDTVRVAVAEANPLTGGLILDVLPGKS